jgi:hypothetical protein
MRQTGYGFIYFMDETTTMSIREMTGKHILGPVQFELNYTFTRKSNFDGPSHHNQMPHVPEVPVPPPGTYARNVGAYGASGGYGPNYGGYPRGGNAGYGAPSRSAGYGGHNLSHLPPPVPSHGAYPAAGRGTVYPHVGNNNYRAHFGPAAGRAGAPYRPEGMVMTNSAPVPIKHLVSGPGGNAPAMSPTAHLLHSGNSPKGGPYGGGAHNKYGLSPYISSNNSVGGSTTTSGASGSYYGSAQGAFSDELYGRDIYGFERDLYSLDERDIYGGHQYYGGFGHSDRGLGYGLGEGLESSRMESLFSSQNSTTSSHSVLLGSLSAIGDITGHSSLPVITDNAIDGLISNIDHLQLVGEVTTNGNVSSLETATESLPTDAENVTEAAVTI